MNNESQLIKDWKERDVQRMRNIITKNYGDRTGVQVGYSRSNKERKEGEQWEENGKQWTIKNGLKQTITRFDELKKIVVLPLNCPNCNKPMKVTPHNKKMWSIHKMCLDCVINNETKLKKENKFQEYEKNMIIKGIKFHIKELEDALLDLSLNSNDTSFVTENGEIEEWKGNNNLRIKLAEELKEYIQKLKDITFS